MCIAGAVFVFLTIPMLIALWRAYREYDREVAKLHAFYHRFDATPEQEAEIRERWKTRNDKEVARA